MKIAVLGDIIDTDTIYQIEEVKYNPRNAYPEDEVYIESFLIKFFNRKELLIQDKNYCYHKGIDKNLMIKLNKLREEVIRYWSNNQSQIPKIEFE